jgi:hypothetical protein
LYHAADRLANANVSGRHALGCELDLRSLAARLAEAQQT